MPRIKSHTNPNGQKGGNVHVTATIGRSVYIGENAYVGEGATVGDYSRIEAGAYVAAGAIVTEETQYTDRAVAWLVRRPQSTITVADLARQIRAGDQMCTCECGFTRNGHHGFAG